MAALGKQTPRRIPTRILILSDTYGLQFPSESKPLESADVAVHCGNLTEHSKLDEFRHAVHLLEEINSPVKLVIAGNNDVTLDIPTFKGKIAYAKWHSKEKVKLFPINSGLGRCGEALELLEKARDKGIIFLGEGSYTIPLENGAVLSVYASPYTPSHGCSWAFQYQGEHEFVIPDNIDIAITHGPPHGVFDRARSYSHIGCPQLFTQVALAQPRIHCFGHVPSDWGARLVTWTKNMPDSPTSFNAADPHKSFLIANLATLKLQEIELYGEGNEEERTRLQTLERRTCYQTSHCEHDKHPLAEGQTLFINTATRGYDGLTQKPWIVTIELPKQLGAESNEDVEVIEEGGEDGNGEDEEPDEEVEETVLSRNIECCDNIRQVSRVADNPT